MFVREIGYKDSYFNISSFSFTVQDNWLRKSDQLWKLEFPAGGKIGWKENGIDDDGILKEVEYESEMVHLLHLLALRSEQLQNTRPLLYLI